ncbi:hypothetical protein B0H34DRAFT_801785 [Crassisporium funariophilum]|nr:hypothetical protein B0H34DRAFT_801785 [Crassisporium funariophilum]
MACSSYHFPVSADATIAKLLQQSLALAFDLDLTPSLLSSDPVLSSLACAADASTVCYGICSNADLGGVGVRIAFWLSSILQAALVAISPEDSTQGAWCATVLTASVTIPAFIQKRRRLLSLYHATLVLNFATFSSIVSLAVAPMCTVWRESPGKCEKRKEDDVQTIDPLPDAEDVRVQFGEEGEWEFVAESPERPAVLPKIKVHRQRLVLSFALLMQVALQWTWSIMLFTDPEYAQKVCSPDTVVVLFAQRFTARAINHHLYILWPIWLLFNLGITLFWGILLVKSSSPSVHPVLSRQPSIIDSSSAWRGRFPMDRGRILLLLGNIVAFLIALLFLVSSEVQVGHNCIRGGENIDWSFGQVAALLLALAPAWSIVAALAKRQAKTSIPRSDTEANGVPYNGISSVLTTSTYPQNSNDGPSANEGPESSLRTVIIHNAEYLAVPQSRNDIRHRTFPQVYNTPEYGVFIA